MNEEQEACFEQPGGKYMDLLLNILAIIGGLIAINVRYYISIHENASFSIKEKKVYFILGNTFVIIMGVVFIIFNA